MESSPEDRRSPRVGLAYDERMCLHATPDGECHPENPERIRAIWQKLEAEGIPERCVLLKTKEAEDATIASVHTKNHIKLIRNISSKAFEFRRLKIASKLNSIYFNEGSSGAAFLAAGTVIEVAENVAKGDLDSAFAVVRPPGHHAEANEAMGFCLFNNVAVAASYLLDKRAELGIKRILIVDWDVHHGNGTQNMFYRDPRVLYFSVHRFDFGSFYPAGWDGSYCMVGEDQGTGYNINVPWEHGQCGDADYLAVWDHILIPVTEAYKPDIILISAGFDAAVDDPLGGCCVTPYGYSVMLNKLMKFADGKIVLALEGGYNLNSLANSVFACAKTLLEGKPVAGKLEGRPFESTWRVINEVRNELKTYWPVFSINLPQEILIANAKPYQIQAGINSSSDSEVERDPQPPNAENSFTNNEVANLILPLSNLNVDDENSGESPSIRSLQNLVVPSAGSACNNFAPWRSSLSKVDVWYGSYGSNMWRPRFLCYIEGGKVRWYIRKSLGLGYVDTSELMVEGMHNSCRGAMDKTPPKNIAWKSVPHRLFFARSYTDTWGHSGVAFLNPQSSIHEKTFMCLYKITLEQFNEILIQENIANEQFESPFVASEDVEFIVKNGSLCVESLKGGWYSNVVYLGEQDGIPILTMTCSASDVEQFKSGELPVCAPSKAYENTLLKGLLEEDTRISTEEAIGYLKDAVTRKL